MEQTRENDMQARRTRVTRGILAAAVSTFAAAFSHGVAASEAPSVFALAAASVLALGICTGLAGRATPLRLAVAVVLSQAGFHALFAFAPAVSGSANASGHHGMVSLTTDAVAHVHGSAGVSMWLAHAAAALGTILALRHGERAGLAIVDSLMLTIRALRGALAPVPLLDRPSAAPAWLPLASMATASLTSSAPRRGPPALFA